MPAQTTERDALLASLNAGDSAHGAELVTGSRTKWRQEFSDVTLADWEVVTGSGMSAAVTAGALVVTTGTTANAVTTLTSKQAFRAPFKAGFGIMVSQKIINQEFYVELVAENADGTVDEACVAAWRFAGSDSLTVTSAMYEVANGALPRLQSSVVTSQASQTSACLYEIVLESDEVWFHSRLTDTNAARNTSYVRQSVSPDPNRTYRLRYRIVNGAVAPASTTTFTSTHVTCVDYTEVQAEITGSTGSIAVAQALPVSVPGGVAATVTSTTIAAGAATIAGLSIAKVASLATTNATNLKATAARVYGYRFFNTSAATKYVRFFNKATAPTPGTDTPVWVVPIGAGQEADLALTIPMTHATGLGYTITGGVADLDATAVAANDVIGFVLWV